MTAVLTRHTHGPEHTAGTLVAHDAAGNIQFACVTLELPWRDNKPQVSCIPEGIYKVVTRRTDKWGLHYHVLDVPEREWILFHPANFTSQLRGCIIPGERLAFIDRDAVPDIVNTKATLNKMLACLGRSFTLHVVSLPVAGGTLPEATVTP